MTTGDAIRKRIRDLLKVKRMTVYRLTYEACLPPSTVKSVLSGKSKSPGACTITQICTGLGVTVREFYDSEIFDDWMMAEDDDEAQEKLDMEKRGGL